MSLKGYLLVIKNLTSFWNFFKRGRVTKSVMVKIFLLFFKKIK